MSKKSKKINHASQEMVDCFGALSISILEDSPVVHAWRISFLANFLVGPVYREMGGQFGLSRPEFVILFCLSQRPGLVARDVCRLTGLPKNSISRAVTLLLKKNLISSEIHADDKRAKTLTITSDGAGKLTAVLPIFEKSQSQMREVLTPDELADFDRLLLKLIFAMPNWVKQD